MKILAIVQRTETREAAIVVNLPTLIPSYEDVEEAAMEAAADHDFTGATVVHVGYSLQAWGEIKPKKPKKPVEDKELYELHYSSGGHGGPYYGLEMAKEAARQFIIGHGGKTHTVECRPYSSPVLSGTGFGLPTEREGSVYVHKDSIK